MDVLEYDIATGRPTLVKAKDSNYVYQVTYDPNTDTLTPLYGQKELIYKDGLVVEVSHHSGNNAESADGSSDSNVQSPSGNESNEGKELTAEKEEIAEKIASGHAWDKHVVGDGSKAPDLDSEFETQEEFAEKIKDIINNPDDVKDLQRGRKAWWDDESGIVVIHDPNSTDKGTAFKPDDGKVFFDEVLQ